MLRLAELRAQEGVSQKKLAEDLHMSAGNLCDWEKGRTEPDIERLIKLADYFDVSLDYLMGREPVAEKAVKPADDLKFRLLAAFGRLTEEGKRNLVEFLEAEDK